MTREEVARTIKYRLVSGSLCTDPIVIVEFANMHFSVLGEVKSPGEKEINKDVITLFEAISKASDLAIQGQRTNVKVLRQEGDKQTPYLVDLTIFVVRSTLMQKSMLPELEKLYDEKKYNNLTMLLNGTDLNNQYGYNRYGYGYGRCGYGYGYGHGYGYGDKK